jgi:hypothetical protein
MTKNTKLNLKNINYLKIAEIIFFAFGAIFLLYNIYEIPAIQNKYPRLHRLVKSYRMEMMAKKQPPNSIMAKRFYAMADALRHNKTTYSFTTNQLPPMAGQ